MDLVFKRVNSVGPAADYLARVIGEKLRDSKQVLWLVPGGSAIAVAAETAKKLGGTPLENLTVTLTDERYGDVGHADSNWPQLQAAGFDLPGATMVPVLRGEDLASTVQRYAEILKIEMDKADFRIGLFGIGADGHTAGMLPHSPAVDETGFAHGYDAGNFVRITMARPAIARLDEAVVYAKGQEKWPVLEQLGTELPVEDQPAQALKQIARVTIFNDHQGDQA
jgi:6-phosphogluconolactonase/glucosamine-6-phosphate isomerase/deaminase